MGNSCEKDQKLAPQKKDLILGIEGENSKVDEISLRLSSYINIHQVKIKEETSKFATFSCAIYFCRESDNNLFLETCDFLKKWFVKFIYF